MTQFKNEEVNILSSESNSSQGNRNFSGGRGAREPEEVARSRGEKSKYNI